MTSRRDLLRSIGTGFGMAGSAQGLNDSKAPGMVEASANPLAPRAPQFPARAKHVIFLFLNGGPSQVDTFDPKPMLTKHDGKPIPGGGMQTERKTGNLMRSPIAFKKCGKSGIEVSEIFPRIGEAIDDI